ncbi:hypothetical protein J9303_14575, partial [Bacillaceae bacterium Marseille-Q3522]|nr:hypothetical protein [Bacillaceae bacterium Marseille-Q3522]
GGLVSRDKLKTNLHKVRIMTLCRFGLRPRAASRRSWTKKSGGGLVKPIGCWSHLDRRRFLPSIQMAKQSYGLAGGAGQRKAEAAWSAATSLRRTYIKSAL